MDEVDSKEKIDRWCRVPEPMVNLREGVSWRRSPRFLIRADEELIMYVQRSSPPWTRSIRQYLIIALLALNWLLLGFVNFVTNISETSEEKYAIGKYVNTSPAAHNSFYIDPYICVILTKILNAFRQIRSIQTQNDINDTLQRRHVQVGKTDKSWIVSPSFDLRAIPALQILAEQSKVEEHLVDIEMI